MNALDAYKKARRSSSAVPSIAGNAASRAINPIQAYKSVRKRRQPAQPNNVTLQRALADLKGSQRGLRLDQIEKTADTPITSSGAARTIMKGLTLNAWDEIESGVRAGFAADKGEDFLDAKKRIRKDVNEDIENFRKGSPWVSMGAEVLGSLATPMPGSSIRKAKSAVSAAKLAKGGVQEALRQAAKNEAKRAAFNDIMLGTAKTSKLKNLVTGNLAKNTAEGALVGGTANAMGAEEGERGQKFIEGAIGGGLLQGAIGGVAPAAARFAKNKLAQPLKNAGRFIPYGLAAGDGGKLSGFYKMASQGFSPLYREQLGRLKPKVQSTLDRLVALTERGDTISRSAKGRSVRRLKRATDLEARENLRKISDDIDKTKETITGIKDAKINTADETKLAQLDKLEQEANSKMIALNRQARELVLDQAIPAGVDDVHRLRYKGLNGQDAIRKLEKDWEAYGFKALKDLKTPIKLDVESIIGNLKTKLDRPGIREYAGRAAKVLRDRVFRQMKQGTISGEELLNARNFLRSEARELLKKGDTKSYQEGKAYKLAAEELEEYITKIEEGGVGKQFAEDLAAYKARRAFEGGKRAAGDTRGDFTPKEYLNSLKSGQQSRLELSGSATSQRQMQQLDDTVNRFGELKDQAAGVIEKEASVAKKEATAEFKKRMEGLRKELADRNLSVTDKRDRVRSAISDYVEKTRGGMQTRQYKETMDKIEKVLKEIDFEPSIFTKMATNRLIQILMTVAASGAGFAAAPILAAAPVTAAIGSAIAMRPGVQRVLAGQTRAQQSLGRALEKYNAVERGNLLGSIAARNMGKD